jgi:hypothetical protein
MIRAEHTHLVLTLLGLLAVLLLAVSVASAGPGGWQEGEGVRYRTYRTPAPTYYPVATTVTAPVVPLVRLGPMGDVRGLTLWLNPGDLGDWAWFGELPPLGPGGPSEPRSGGKGNPE